VKELFAHPDIETYDFEDLPLGHEVWLMDEKYTREFARELRNLGDYFSVGYVSKMIANSRDATHIGLTWYLQPRFHKIDVVLPRSAFVIGVDRPSHDTKLRAFVRGEWLERLHLRRYSSFGLVDAIGMKDAIRSGRLTHDLLISLRDRIDAIAAEHPEAAFVSMADNLLIKFDWTIGHFESDVPYDYAPEKLLRLLPDVARAFREELSMDCYAVITQGGNEYDDLRVMHVSPTSNHVSLNSLGEPFAQLMRIEEAVRSSIRKKTHAPSDVYMDANFFTSLQFERHRFDPDDVSRHAYDAPTTTDGRYVCGSLQQIIEALR